VANLPYPLPPAPGVNGRHANPNEDVELPKQKTNIICTLGPVSRDIVTLEAMLRAGMRVARFNFSLGSHEYHQETLDVLRMACDNTGIFCAVLLDTKGPEIRTGMLENGEPVMLEKDSRVVLTTDYKMKGNAQTIAVSYPCLARDVAPGQTILCADGSITFTVISCDAKKGTVTVRISDPTHSAFSIAHTRLTLSFAFIVQGELRERGETG